MHNCTQNPDIYNDTTITDCEQTFTSVCFRTSAKQCDRNQRRKVTNQRQAAPVACCMSTILFILSTVNTGENCDMYKESYSCECYIYNQTSCLTSLYKKLAERGTVLAVSVRLRSELSHLYYAVHTI